MSPHASGISRNILFGMVRTRLLRIPYEGVLTGSVGHNNKLEKLDLGYTPNLRA